MSPQQQLAPLPPRRVFVVHVAKNAGIAAGVLAVSLTLGAAGYHWLERLPWVDAFMNASMILTGMGPVDHPVTTNGKLFATVYALFSGLVFLFTAALLLTPALRRVLHRLHLDMRHS